MYTVPKGVSQSVLLLANYEGSHFLIPALQVSPPGGARQAAGNNEGDKHACVLNCCIYIHSACSCCLLL